jgi:hypothetical protein
MCCDSRSDHSTNCCCQTSGHHGMSERHKFNQEVCFPSRSEPIEPLKEHKKKLLEQIKEIDEKIKDLE